MPRIPVSTEFPLWFPRLCASPVIRRHQESRGELAWVARIRRDVANDEKIKNSLRDRKDEFNEHQRALCLFLVYSKWKIRNGSAALMGNLICNMWFAKIKPCYCNGKSLRNGNTCIHVYPLCAD